MAPETGLARARCVQHPERQAVVRCPECRDFFCRECAVEHQSRLLCRACLARVTDRTPSTRQHRGLLARSIRRAASVGGAAFGLLVAWLFFYGLGRVLLLLPTGTDGPGSEAPAAAPPEASSP